jgi:hypothetical protein
VNVTRIRPLDRQCGLGHQEASWYLAKYVVRLGSTDSLIMEASMMVMASSSMKTHGETHRRSSVIVGDAFFYKCLSRTVQYSCRSCYVLDESRVGVGDVVGREAAVIVAETSSLRLYIVVYITQGKLPYESWRIWLVSLWLRGS